MCVIICKRRGLNLPSDDVIEKCFRSNKDGFGLAFIGKEDEAVTIRKGAMDLPAIKQMIRGVKDAKNKDMILHFRHATQGKVCPENCHPFPLNAKRKWLQCLHLTTPFAVAHNGVITIGEDGSSSRAGCTINSELSDTQYFIRHYLARLGMAFFNEAVKKLILHRAGGKFAVLSRQGIMTLGDFTNRNGLLYSNTTWDWTGTSYNRSTSSDVGLFGSCDFCGRYAELRPIVPYIYICRYCAYTMGFGLDKYLGKYTGLPTEEPRKAPKLADAEDTVDTEVVEVKDKNGKALIYVPKAKEDTP